jgi:hypothetical protein
MVVAAIPLVVAALAAEAALRAGKAWVSDHFWHASQRAFLSSVVLTQQKTDI